MAVVIPLGLLSLDISDKWVICLWLDLSLTEIPVSGKHKKQVSQRASVRVTPIQWCHKHIVEMMRISREVVSAPRSGSPDLALLCQCQITTLLFVLLSSRPG